MSERSLDSLFSTDADESTASPEGLRANPQAARGSARAVRMSDGFGGIICDLCGKSVPCSCWQRTLAESLRSNLTALTGFETSWRKRVTRQCRLLLVLDMSARRTVATGCGSSGDWPTPRAEDSEQTGAHRGEPDTLTSKARQWLTPAGMTGTDHTGKAGAGGEFAEQVRKSEWPTPTASEQANRNEQSPPSHGVTRGLTLAGVVGDNVGPPDPVSDSTNGKRRDWCSPQASLGDAGTRSRSGKRRHELLLAGQAKEGFSQTSSSGKSQSSSAQPSGSLNPDWVSQLMGLPADWLHLPDETLCGLLGTRSCGKRRSKSGAP